MSAGDRLAELYAEVPDAGCKGLCVDACGPLPMTVLEARRLRRAGYPIPHDDIATSRVLLGEPYSCPALDAEGRCSVYELRPLVCRLYGAAERLECEHGCRPADGLLPAARARELIALVDDAGGGQR